VFHRTEANKFRGILRPPPSETTKGGDNFFEETLLNVLSFGYESTPDTPINAGSCSGSEKSGQSMQEGCADGGSLGMLALGSVGLDLKNNRHDAAAFFQIAPH
jgi:hypothetical protein